MMMIALVQIKYTLLKDKSDNCLVTFQCRDSEDVRFYFSLAWKARNCRFDVSDGVTDSAFRHSGILLVFCHRLWAEHDVS